MKEIPKEIINEIEIVSKVLCYKYGCEYLYEDLLQEGVIGYLQALKTFKKGKGSIKTWTSLGIRNQIQKFINKNIYQTQRINEDFFIIKENYFCKELKKSINNLTSLEIKVLKYKIINNLSFKKIANKLKIDYRKVNFIYFNTLKKLRKELGVSI